MSCLCEINNMQDTQTHTHTPKHMQMHTPTHTAHRNVGLDGCEMPLSVLNLLHEVILYRSY